MEVCTGEIENILLKTESDEDQTIGLSDDEDEAKIVYLNSKDVTFVTSLEFRYTIFAKERIVEPKETKSEIRTRSGRISKRPN